MEFYHFNNPQFLAIIIACVTFFAVWELVWKGLALWKAAKNNHGVWFFCIFVFNTVGILPIIYLLLNRDKKE